MNTLVYKFMSGEEHHLDALKNNQVYFSCIDQLNDPYEGLTSYCSKNVTHAQRMAVLTQKFKHDHIKISGARKEAESFYKKNGAKYFNEHIDKLCKEEYQDFLEYHKKHRFILSLSKAFSSEVFSSPLNDMMMWAHYGNGMRGFCVEYDFNTLYESINLLNDENLSTDKIKYERSTLPIVKATTLLDDLAMNTKKTSVEILNAFCTKHASWSYENEVRLISSKHKLHYIHENSILRVFVSAKNQDLMSEVIKILKVKKYKPELYEVIIHGDVYGFEFRNIQY